MAIEYEKRAADNFALIQYIYIALSVIYLLFGLNSNNKLLKLVLKCAPIGTLLALSGFTTFRVMNDYGPMATGPMIEVLDKLFWGLLFSILGDMYLVFNSLFLLGIASFAIAQATYIYVFDGMVLLTIPLEQQQIMTAIAIGLVSFLIYSYIFSKLSWVLSVATLVYCVLISVMLWCAFVRAQLTPSKSNVAAAIGACLFYMSDLVLALKLWRIKIPSMDILVMVTYYGAQLFISRSVMVQV